MPGNWKSELFFGGNLSVPHDHVNEGSVDHVYLDPPLNSNATCNVVFRGISGGRYPLQVAALEDTSPVPLQTAKR